MRNKNNVIESDTDGDASSSDDEVSRSLMPSAPCASQPATEASLQERQAHMELSVAGCVRSIAEYGNKVDQLTSSVQNCLAEVASMRNLVSEEVAKSHAVVRMDLTERLDASHAQLMNFMQLFCQLFPVNGIPLPPGLASLCSTGGSVQPQAPVESAVEQSSEATSRKKRKHSVDDDALQRQTQDVDDSAQGCHTGTELPAHEQEVVGVTDRKSVV